MSAVVGSPDLVRIKTHVKGFGFDAKTTNRVTKELMMYALSKALLTWKERVFPGHFTTAAHGKYMHEPRGKGYMIRKARRFGHTIDNVFTGAMKYQMVNTFRRPRGNAKSMKLGIVGPEYLNHSRGPKKHHELSRVLPQEVMEVMLPIVEKEIQAGLDELDKEMSGFVGVTQNG